MSWIVLVFLLIYYNRKNFLTGLWKLSVFKRKADRILRRYKGCNYRLSSVDIRGFKNINARYGPSCGDSVLKFYANELRKIRKRTGALLGYDSADNFYILERIDSPEKSLSRIQKDIDDTIRYSKEFGIGFFIKEGIVFVGKDYGIADIYVLLGRASYAKNFIKEDLIHNISVYTDQMERQALRENFIEANIERALINGEFFVVYQPKYDLQTGVICGAEALARWNYPCGDILLPADFIPIFEKTGYIDRLDFNIYRQVFDFIQKRINTNLPVVPISINMSKNYSNAECFVNRFNELFSEYTISPDLIELEIVERRNGEKNIFLKDVTELLHRDGFTVAMDDFGQGESSLFMLEEIPVDIIKFDRAFISSDQNEASRKILAVVMDLAKNLGKKTICEGIETEQQLLLLKQLRCDQGQGFYYSKPVSEKTFSALLDAEEPVI